MGTTVAAHCMRRLTSRRTDGGTAGARLMAEYGRYSGGATAFARIRVRPGAGQSRL
jgi:hypothetical protein